MKQGLKDDTSVTEDETNLGDDYDAEVAALASSFSSCSPVKAVRFSPSQTALIANSQLIQ
jgi:hypothetical protein